MISCLHRPRGRRRLASIACAVSLLAARGRAAGSDVGGEPDVAVKAAFLFNFAKFAEWPALPVNAPLVLCAVGADDVANALATIVHGQSISDHSIEVLRPQDAATWRGCHLLFMAEAETRRSSGGLIAIRSQPVLTVSDAAGFSQAGGIIELYVEGGRMRFAINVDAAARAGLHLSSRLLGLARIVRDDHDE